MFYYFEKIKVKMINNQLKDITNIVKVGGGKVVGYLLSTSTGAMETHAMKPHAVTESAERW